MFDTKQVPLFVFINVLFYFSEKKQVFCAWSPKIIKRNVGNYALRPLKKEACVVVYKVVIKWFKSLKVRGTEILRSTKFESERESSSKKKFEREDDRNDGRDLNSVNFWGCVFFFLFFLG